MNNKISKHDWACKITESVALRATCKKKQVGAVFFTNDYEILTTGYNGAPSKHDECLTHNCLLDDQRKCIRCVHAEINAIINASKQGICLSNSILYITLFPCRACAMALCNLGVSVIYYRDLGKGQNIIPILDISSISTWVWEFK